MSVIFSKLVYRSTKELLGNRRHKYVWVRQQTHGLRWFLCKIESFLKTPSICSEHAVYLHCRPVGQEQDSLKAFFVCFFRGMKISHKWLTWVFLFCKYFYYRFISVSDQCELYSCCLITKSSPGHFGLFHVSTQEVITLPCYDFFLVNMLLLPSRSLLMCACWLSLLLPIMSAHACIKETEQVFKECLPVSTVTGGCHVGGLTDCSTAAFNCCYRL